MKVFLLVLFVGAAKAMYYTNLELVSTLQAAGMDGYAGVSLANWVCLAFAESSYNTNAIHYDSDGSTDYGIFQINDRWWCSNGQFPSYNGCGISCNQLMSDNIQAEIACAKIIVKQQVISAWVGWQLRCEGQDVSQYIAGCGV
ncbi:LOW QUALITY PROTEIN: lysozyme C-like [Hoplias malabaricus]|uniref:LOW QUALITY PROTEIN: lysozyme C-like n=1 Tax=Hoplias malabaricus TaxID=27720 RepID=UPI003461E8AC